jgi:serine/threonine protein kinase
MNPRFPDFSNHGYQVLRPLGHNAQGGRITYLAEVLEDRSENQAQESEQRTLNDCLLVVIKYFQFGQLDSDWKSYSGYEQEIKVLKQIDHPCIPRYIKSFETVNGFCLAQEYKQAPSLAEHHAWTPAEIEQIAAETLKVLVDLQEQTPPILHRDLKPENILVNLQNPNQVYLVDFGFARSINETFSQSSFIKGTLGFMPPEQIFNRPLTTASDVGVYFNFQKLQHGMLGATLLLQDLEVLLKLQTNDLKIVEKNVFLTTTTLKL